VPLAQPGVRCEHPAPQLPARPGLPGVRLVGNGVGAADHGSALAALVEDDGRRAVPVVGDVRSQSDMDATETARSKLRNSTVSAAVQLPGRG
jgi:hypothetical protein